MEPVDLHAFWLNPFGRYLAGRTWLTFCAQADLWGFVIWGRPDRADATRFLETLPGPAFAVRQAAAWFVDARRLDTPDPAAFDLFASEFALHATNFTTRAAVVHSRAVGGAIVAGFRNVVSVPFPFQLFTEPESALRWLGFSETGLLDELDRLQARATRTTPLRRDLSAFLAAHLREATVDDAAAALRISTRTLQRRLGEQALSFQRELHAARVEQAKRLLAESDASVGEIAFEVGYASSHRFSAVFRRLTGSTPHSWRGGLRAQRPAP